MSAQKEEKSPTHDMHSLKEYLEKEGEKLWVVFSQKITVVETNALFLVA